jgi:transcriptional regulator with XRE-family HTH domain
LVKHVIGPSVDVSLLIRHRLNELGLDQKDLAAAAQVTESYISQLLARKKAPPAPGRTDIYEKIGKALKLRPSELSNLADQQRKEELRKKVADPPRPLFKECRALILRKCNPARQRECRFLRRSLSASSNGWSLKTPGCGEGRGES